MNICPHCHQSFNDEEPRWDCACGPRRPVASSPAFSVAATDDPDTWYDNYSCFPIDISNAETTLLRRPVPRPPFPG